MTGNDARSQATLQKTTVWSAEKRRTCTIDYCTGGKKWCTEASFTTKGIRLMKHKTSYYNSSKKRFLAITLQWETRKLIFPLKRKNWPELSKLTMSFTFGEKRHTPYRLQMPTHTLEILQALTDAKHWDHLPTLAFPISFSKVSSNSKCFKWAPITDA